jgi:monoamine oxidase
MSRGFSRREALRLLGAGAAGSLAARIGRGATSRTPPARADVVVVGAGLAGLAAAQRLRRRGRSVVVVEARDRIGGRMRAGRIAGQTVDLGAMWVGPGQDRMHALLDAHGIATMPQFMTGRGVTELAGRRFEGEGESLTFGPEDDAAYAAILARIDAFAAGLPAESPWTAPDAEAWDRLTMDEWVRSQTGSPVVRAMMRLIVRGLFTVEPEQLSLLFFLDYVRSGGSLERLWAIEDGAQARHVPGGIYRLAARMAGELDGAIALAAPVRAIVQDASGVSVQSAAGTWRAGYAIVSVPLPLAARIGWDPALPSRRDALLQRSPMGSVIKYWVAYREPFWRREGSNALVASDAPPTDGFFDCSPPDQSVGLIVGFFEARSALEWTGRPQAERQGLIVKRIAEFLGPRAAQPLEYLDADWPADPWTRGCYGASMGPGVLTSLGPELRAPFGRVHWAGTELSTEWTGYMEGAVRSGERAAEEVAARARS